MVVGNLIITSTPKCNHSVRCQSDVSSCWGHDIWSMIAGPATGTLIHPLVFSDASHYSITMLNGPMGGVWDVVRGTLLGAGAEVISGAAGKPTLAVELGLLDKYSAIGA